MPIGGIRPFGKELLFPGTLQAPGNGVGRQRQQPRSNLGVWNQIIVPNRAMMMKQMNWMEHEYTPTNDGTCWNMDTYPKIFTVLQLYPMLEAEFLRWPMPVWRMPCSVTGHWSQNFQAFGQSESSIRITDSHHVLTDCLSNIFDSDHFDRRSQILGVLGDVRAHGRCKYWHLGTAVSHQSGPTIMA